MVTTSEYTPPPQTGQGTSAPAYAATQGAAGGGFGAQPAPNPNALNALSPAVQNQYNNLNALGNLFGTAILGPNQAMGDYQMGNLQDQLGLLFASGDYQSQLANQQAGFAQQNLGLDNAALGIQRGALDRQNALMPQQQALVEQIFGLQGGALDRQDALLPQQQALVDQMFGQQGAELGWQADTAHKANLSAATARGAVGSEGDIGRDRNIDVGHMYQQASLNNRQQGQHLSYNEQLAALKDQHAYLANQKEAQNLSYQERLAQNKDAQKMLDISASRLGISSAEVQSRLQGALNQLGISTSLSVDQLLQEANKIQEGQLSPISPLINEIYGISGVPLTAPPGQSPQGAPQGPGNTGTSNRVIQGVS